MSGKLIENVINEKLTGDAQKNALDFVAFLQANDLKIEPNGDDFGGWAVGGVVGDSLGFMLINGVAEVPGPWTIWFNSCDFGDADLVSDDLKETVWANTSICGKCHANWETCGGDDRIIFGRKFERLCHSPLMFNNPDAGTLENMQKLMLILK